MLGKAPMAILDLIIMGTQSVVFHAPMDFGPQSCPALSAATSISAKGSTGKPWARRFSSVEMAFKSWNEISSEPQVCERMPYRGRVDSSM